MTLKYSASVYLHSVKSSKRSKADFTVGNIYFWLTIFRKDRVLLSCTVGPSFQNWIYEVMFNVFLLVEGVNPLLEREKRRHVQRLMNNSWRKTIKCINTPPVSAVRRALVCRAGGRGFKPQPNQQPESSKNCMVRWCWLLFKTLSQLRWSRRWAVTLRRWPWVEMLQLHFLLSNGALKRVRPFASMHTAIKCTIRSDRAADFDYCSAVWDRLTQQLTEKLQLNFN